MNIGNYYFNKRQIIFFIILSAGLIASVYLVLNRQIFKSRASVLNRSFTITQDTNPEQPAECTGDSCKTETLNIIIKPNLQGEPSSIVAAQVTAPAPTSNAKISSSVGYYIPFRDASVRIPDPDAVKKYILNNPNWPNARIENFDTIVEKSRVNGWNSAFMIALWMEESGAQGKTPYADAFGCEPTNPTTDIEKSLGCVFKFGNSHPNISFDDFMCIWGGDGFHKAPCTFDSDNVPFPGGVSDMYSIVVPPGNHGALVR